MSIQSKILLFLFVIFMGLTAGILTINYRSEKAFVEKVIQEQAHEAVEQYFDSVNTLMISGAMEQREVLREKALKRKNILEAKIMRTKAVKDLFGEGFKHESAENELEEKALSGFSYEAITEKNGERILTVMTPFRASSNFRGTNCIECHLTPEGTVLGAVKITYSLKELDQQLNENAKRTGKIMIGLFLAVLILTALILRGIIISPIKKISQLISNIAENFDLTLRANMDKRSDEIGEMSKNFNLMLGKIHHAMEEVDGAGRNLIKDSEKIYQLTKESERSLIEQRDETTKVASAVAEMNSTAKMVSDHTDETKLATMKANEDANNGKNKARLANEKISELEVQIQTVGKEIENLHRLSQGIDNIIKMINEITLKTTLLSFNASVEAARAGIHGKGFSVVAQEIGQLANQTKGSTKDIALITEELKNKMELTSKLMSETVLKAREGKEFVGQSTHSLEAISNEVAKVTEMAQSISVAAKEQSMASESVDRNLGTITSLTDQNVESARELNLVGEGLQSMALKLDELIKSFKI